MIQANSVSQYFLVFSSLLGFVQELTAKQTPWPSSGFLCPRAPEQARDFISWLRSPARCSTVFLHSNAAKTSAIYTYIYITLYIYTYKYTHIVPQTGLLVRGSYSFDRGAVPGRMILHLSPGLRSCHTVVAVAALLYTCLPFVSHCLLAA